MQLHPWENYQIFALQVFHHGRMFAALMISKVSNGFTALALKGAFSLDLSISPAWIPSATCNTSFWIVPHGDILSCLHHPDHPGQCGSLPQRYTGDVFYVWSYDLSVLNPITGSWFMSYLRSLETTMNQKSSHRQTYWFVSWMLIGTSPHCRLYLDLIVFPFWRESEPYRWL